MTDINRQRERPRRAITILGVSRTQQHMARECDINVIMAKYANTGLISHVAKVPGAFQDLPAAIDFEDAHALLLDAERQFKALPSKLRLEFDNDPQVFLAFVEDPANRERMIELGMIPKPAEPAPVADSPASPSA